MLDQVPIGEILEHARQAGQSDFRDSVERRPFKGLAEEIGHTFLTTAFEGGRHARRVAQIADLEAQF